MSSRSNLPSSLSRSVTHTHRERERCRCFRQKRNSGEEIRGSDKFCNCTLATVQGQFLKLWVLYQCSPLFLGLHSHYSCLHRLPLPPPPPPPLSPGQLNEAKKKVDDDQLELEEVQNGKRKLDQEAKALQERLEELKAENAKLARGKKKVQGEVHTIDIIH